MDELYRERFARSFGIFNDDQLELIRSTPVGIAGLGMGGSTFINLVRMGFEKFHIADPDIYERTNINRQRLAKESTVKQRKDESLLAEARDINPAIEVQTFPDGVQPENVDAFLDGLAWVVDVVDVFAMDCKLILNERAHEQGVKVASSATIGHGTSVMVFDEDTPSFGELSGITAGGDKAENLDRFLKLLVPEVPEYMKAQLEEGLAGRSHIPFVVTGTEFSGAIIVTEIVKHLMGWGDRPKAPVGIYCEPVELRLERFTSTASR